ncbi:unnamed protein product [Bursaphelenchus xylophilus]|uniref:dual-specificity kinase n=1 Tax=Bursaphelenchus xylophilus TaxID=6326 RepID=A0A1I7RYT9_BURXY|nr:unnamed protein product [Bursaphelenchus xylophilus]CAG9092234.1 unnamed protein product [Bursaphelenchus xylophilus]
MQSATPEKCEDPLVPMNPQMIAETSAQALKEDICQITHPSPILKQKTKRVGASFNAVGCLKYVEDFEILETLGRGFFGVAYKVREKRQSDGKSGPTPVLVMKEPLITNSQSSVTAKKIVSDEYYVLRSLRHPNILKTRGICVQQCDSEWKLNLLVDFCDSGSLQQTILNTSIDFDWFYRCHIALDICSAMDFVHRKGFMHRDLTSMNILLQSQFRSHPKAIVADFGLSCKIPQKGEVKQQVGTQNWMAPEMLMERIYDEKADVFSFGIICCQMIARLDADHDAGLYRTPSFGLDYVRFTAHCPSDTPLSLLKTAFLCCLWNSESRPSFNELSRRLKEILRTDLPKLADTFAAHSADQIRIGRSHSDAEIRPVVTPMFSTRRFLCEENSIPEGVTVSVGGMETDPPTPIDEINPMTSEDLDRRLRQLAKHVAEEDPDYQESSMNPFSKHDRYRSMRKIKPGDLAFLTKFGAKSADKTLNEPILETEDAESMDEKPPSSRKTSIKRCRSMPQLLFTPATECNRSPPLLKVSKRSFTLGLGEQRELQGRITMTFRDYDMKFTKSTSKSSHLQSVNDVNISASDDSINKDLFLLDIEQAARDNEALTDTQSDDSVYGSRENGLNEYKMDLSERISNIEESDEVDKGYQEVQEQPIQPNSPYKMPLKSKSVTFCGPKSPQKSPTKSKKNPIRRLSSNLDTSQCSIC